ncbi:MAG: hypothetical protein LBP98_03895 [Tannerella sp.]|jgi:hypothetical protein|nr:hypothetical protein [Tannerella sp.]
MKTNLILPACLLALLSACSDIERTIFIRDDHDSNLPAYTEWGYNSFGAKYERLYFFVHKSIVPCKITHWEGRLHFSLAGILGEDTYGYYDSLYPETMTLTVSFPAEPMYEYRDLVALHGRVIDLADASCEVNIERTDQTGLTVTPIKGHLTFRRAQLLRIDEKENRVILSGNFDLQFLANGKPESIADGRFDVGIYTDFYSFD